MTFADHWRTKALEAERRARDAEARALTAERLLDIAITLAAETLLAKREPEPDHTPITDPDAEAHAAVRMIAAEISAVGDPDAEWVMATIIKRTAELYLQQCTEAPEP